MARKLFDIKDIREDGRTKLQVPFITEGQQAAMHEKALKGGFTVWKMKSGSPTPIQVYSSRFAGKGCYGASEVMGVKLPTFDDLINPLLRALHSLGGSGSVEEIYDKVVEMEHLPDKVLAQQHDPEKSNMSEVAYRLAWARTYLKKYGLLENSSRGVWALTAEAKRVQEVNTQEVVRAVRALGRKKPSFSSKTPETEDTAPHEVSEDLQWKQRLYELLTQKLSAAAFERLVQRVLRESGFTKVEVTGRSGDGGIDGRGIARIHGMMSFHVLFQCKRYRGTVGPGEIRDFRGAMVGRADKGLFITTGTFTPAAIKEATRDGAPPIDLVNGDEFAEKLKEFKLGVQTETIEVVSVKDEWFDSV
jgi:restriction system protein